MKKVGMAWFYTQGHGKDSEHFTADDASSMYEWSVCHPRTNVTHGYLNDMLRIYDITI